MSGLVAIKSLAPVASSALKFVFDNWRYIAVVALSLSVYHLDNRAIYWHSEYAKADAQIKTNADTYKAAQVKATEDNKKAVAATELKWKTATDNTQEDLNAKLSIAYASVDSYAARLRKAVTASGRAAGTGVIPEVTGPAGGVGGASGGAVVYVPVPESDLKVCAANTVKAKGWQDFYGELRSNQTGAQTPQE